MKDLIKRVVIPTVIFRHPIRTSQDYDIQGLLLAFGKYRESDDLTDWEKTRLKQLASTGKWIESGGTIDDGLWVKDGTDCFIYNIDTLKFIEGNCNDNQVSLVNVEYDTEAEGCIGIWCDILGEPNIGQQIREWVEQNGEWMDIEEFVSHKKVDVGNSLKGTSPTYPALCFQR